MLNKILFGDKWGKWIFISFIAFIICSDAAFIYFFVVRNPIKDSIYKGNLAHLEQVLPPGKLQKLTPIELRILRNTIYAKYGYDFGSSDLFSHFSQFSWYKNTSPNVDSKLSDIDNLNIALIQYYEKNNIVSTKKINMIWPKNIFKNTSPSKHSAKISEPVFDIEITLKNDFFKKTISTYLSKFNELPFSFIQSIITDSNLRASNINYIFVGMNLSDGNYDCVILFDIKDKTFSLKNNFKNFDLKYDTYNNNIMVANYNSQRYFFYYSKQRLYISRNKNLAYESATGNLSKRFFNLNGDIDAVISSKLASVCL